MQIKKLVVVLIIVTPSLVIHSQQNKKEIDVSWIKVSEDVPKEYKTLMERAKKALINNDWIEATKNFGLAMRISTGDLKDLAAKGFRIAIKELEIYNTRFGELKERAIKSYCDESSEDLKKIIEAGLKWLVKVQKEDGHWEGRRPFGHMTDDKATTALALMALLADGNSEVTGPYSENVKKAIDWLIHQQQVNGSFGGASFYTEGIVVLAIVEAFVMGGTEKTFEAAQKGITYIVNSQRKGGGWVYTNDYEHGCDGDVSVTGNVFQVLKQAQMAYLDFDITALERTAKFADNATDENGWIYYRVYGGQKMHHKTIALTAIGNLIRLYAGAELSDEKVQKGIKLVLEHKNDARDNIYFMYFGTMLSFLEGDNVWREWRDMLIPHLKEKQLKDGEDAGSWNVEGGLDIGHKGSHPLKDYMSRVDFTALALLSLEACYRYVPEKMVPK